MTSGTDPIVDALKAAGEPTRLRVLALLRRGDLAVGELVQILDQSQPRLSHHLKTLTTAGLVERLPEGAWVFYRARSKDWAGRILNAIFEEIDTDTAPYAQDREALKSVRQARAQSAETYFSEIAESWDQLQGNSLRSGNVPTALLPEQLGLVAAVPLSDGVYTSPVVSDGRVFVVDGSVFPALPAKNLTFTLMANATRVATEAF